MIDLDVEDRTFSCIRVLLDEMYEVPWMRDCVASEARIELLEKLQQTGYRVLDSPVGRWRWDEPCAWMVYELVAVGVPA